MSETPQPNSLDVQAKVRATQVDLLASGFRDQDINLDVIQERVEGQGSIGLDAVRTPEKPQPPERLSTIGAKIGNMLQRSIEDVSLENNSENRSNVELSPEEKGKIQPRLDELLRRGYSHDAINPYAVLGSVNAQETGGQSSGLLAVQINKPKLPRKL